MTCPLWAECVAMRSTPSIVRFGPASGHPGPLRRQEYILEEEAIERVRCAMAGLGRTNFVPSTRVQGAAEAWRRVPGPPAFPPRT